MPFLPTGSSKTTPINSGDGTFRPYVSQGRACYAGGDTTRTMWTLHRLFHRDYDVFRMSRLLSLYYPAIHPQEFLRTVT
jgi:hypothetical protein